MQCLCVNTHTHIILGKQNVLPGSLFFCTFILFSGGKCSCKGRTQNPNALFDNKNKNKKQRKEERSCRLIFSTNQERVLKYLHSTCPWYASYSNMNTWNKHRVQSWSLRTERNSSGTERQKQTFSSAQYFTQSKIFTTTR